jgi:hypothetical protein
MSSEVRVGLVWRFAFGVGAIAAPAKEHRRLVGGGLHRSDRLGAGRDETLGRVTIGEFGAL